MRKLLAMLAATALASGAAIAGDKKDDYMSEAHPEQPTFAELDADGDNLIDREEAREYRALTQVLANFDYNRDGNLNKEEYAEARTWLENEAARR